MALEPKVREQVEQYAAQLRRLLYGETGAPAWGTKFDELEDQAVEVGDAVAQCLMSQALQEQAQRAAEQPPPPCAVCGRQAAADDVQPRVVQTRRGEVAWRESQHYCRHCRRAFFPSQP